MDSELKEAMTAGVYVEFRDALGNTVGQAVYTAWQGRPLPKPGDLVACTVTSPRTGRKQKLRGHVIERHFELQHEEDGRPCVWARLLVESRAESRRSRHRVGFSLN